MSTQPPIHPDPIVRQAYDLFRRSDYWARHGEPKPGHTEILKIAEWFVNHHSATDEGLKVALKVILEGRIDDVLLSGAVQGQGLRVRRARVTSRAVDDKFDELAVRAKRDLAEKRDKDEEKR